MEANGGKMKKLITLTAGTVLGICLLGLSTRAHAADYTLTIASWAPPTHGMNAEMWPELTRMIEEVTDGRVTAEIKYGLAPPPAMMDLVLDGAADMTWIFHGYQAGRFTATKLIELPGYTGNAEAASVAYWKTHEKYLAPANEHRGVQLVGLHTHGPAQVQSNKPVSSLADIAGMKLRVPGGVGSDVGAALGATGIQVPAPKVYETLASKAADGVVMPVEARKGFKLTEVAKNLYEIPGGLYRGSFATIISEEALANLPEDLRTAIVDNVFGEPASRLAGQVWDKIDVIGREVTEGAADNTITPASDADIAAWNKIADDITATVLADVTEKGVDASAAHQMIIDVMASESQ